jgi:hypothetical protein
MRRILNFVFSIFLFLSINSVAHGFLKESPCAEVIRKANDCPFVSNGKQIQSAVEKEASLLELVWQDGLYGRRFGKGIGNQHLLLAKGPFGKPREEEQALSFPKLRPQRDTPGGSIAPNHSGGRPSTDGTGRELKNEDLRTEKLPEPGDMPPPPLPDPSGKMPVLDQPIPLKD